MFKPLSAIVNENYQAAQVLEKYGLDFCCNGKRTLEKACENKSQLIDLIVAELNEVLSKPAPPSRFDDMTLTELTEYIVRRHHTYVRQNMPVIISYLLKVATKHGDAYPFIKRVFVLFSQIRTELDFHLDKEEKVVFEKIRELDQNPLTSNHPDYFDSAILLMEGEHEVAGALMAKIRELTNNYKAPEKACTTFQLALNALRDFEADLHQHVHLENNVLFPKALEHLRKRTA